MPWSGPDLTFSMVASEGSKIYRPPKQRDASRSSGRQRDASRSSRQQQRGESQRSSNTETQRGASQRGDAAAQREFATQKAARREQQQPQAAQRRQQQPRRKRGSRGQGPQYQAKRAQRRKARSQVVTQNVGQEMPDRPAQPPIDQRSPSQLYYNPNLPISKTNPHPKYSSEFERQVCETYGELYDS